MRTFVPNFPVFIPSFAGVAGARGFVDRIVELLGFLAVYFSKQTAKVTDMHVQQRSDEELVRLFQEGDRYAFEMLVRRYQNLAFTVCRRYLNNPEVAEETAQDVFVNLYRKLHKFRGESSFKSWFYRVLVNHCHNKHKALVRRKQHLHDSIDAHVSDDERSRPVELVDGGLDPEARLSAQRQQEQIEEALQRIGEEGRMVLLLREGQGMTYEEIAEALSIRVGTVKSRIHRARAELKTQIEKMTLS